MKNGTIMIKANGNNLLQERFQPLTLTGSLTILPYGPVISRIKSKFNPRPEKLQPLAFLATSLTER
jgi:hypothetical protein